MALGALPSSVLAKALRYLEQADLQRAGAVCSSFASAVEVVLLARSTSIMESPPINWIARGEPFRRLTEARQRIDLNRRRRWSHAAANARWHAILATSRCRRVPEVCANTPLASRTEPAIIIGYAAARGWRGVVEWEPARLLQHVESGTILRCGEDGDGKEVGLSVADMLKYCISQSDQMPLYLFDHEFGEKAPELVNGYVEPTEIIQPPDLMSLLGVNRPPWRWFALGAGGSGCDVHQDPINTCSWNVVVHGVKRWAFLHPSLSAKDVGLDTLVDDEPTLEWFCNVLPAVAARHPSHVLVVDAPAGSLVYIPPGWWHATWNLSTVSVAITHNVVTWSIFCECWCRLAAAFTGMQILEVLEGLEHEFGLSSTNMAESWLRAIVVYADGHRLSLHGLSHVARLLDEAPRRSRC